MSHYFWSSGLILQVRLCFRVQTRGTFFSFFFFCFWHPNVLHRETNVPKETGKVVKMMPSLCDIRVPTNRKDRSINMTDRSILILRLLNAMSLSLENNSDHPEIRDQMTGSWGLAKVCKHTTVFQLTGWLNNNPHTYMRSLSDSCSVLLC